ncbi:apoptotic protease-activating factor 1 [Holotrichia oblita]|uniref:Apoptotic protease-activating factor 1 n=1 Tax=Holotrichia oblita TaxID=644536 RepID=A0ACB9SUU5_HOLOL|nr:apoptotic protease-activating factor 1 [Holotrichia oblita]
MDILYKFLVEDNIEKIKENVSPKIIRDDLYELQLIDSNQHTSLKKVTNEEGLDILLKNLSLWDNGGQKYKQFVEGIIQKKYDWVYKDLQISLENNDWIQNKYKAILNYGDFPRKPAHYVDRYDKITQVQNSLRKLPRTGKVILCGMTGSGKTSLVMGVMTREMVIEAFVGKVFWITVGNADDEQLLMLLSKQIDGSFKYDETCALFAKCLEKPVNYVQRIPEVEKIHELCCGHPFSIALFGSQIATYKETLLDSDSRKWRQFIEMLQKNYSNQQNLISACIETLDEKIRNRYSDFAIFPEDVNISSKVLEIMWNLDEFQVRDIMQQLENKSLIVSYYSNDQHNYIFGIHVVLLAYLKNRYKNELKEKHVRLISAYKKSCNDDFSRLNDDNYIYQYIGYHLKRADSIKDFKIYFDLKFIGAKIKTTGIGDILKDFNIYRKEIEEQIIADSKSVVTEIESFIKKFGDDLHKHEDISIIQCALQYCKETFIYKKALEVAHASNSSLYFKIQTPEKNCDHHVAKFQLPENCTFVCFAENENQLLIGTKEGVIELWDRIYRKVICKFIGHTQSVNYIEIYHDEATFLSISDDGFVYLWRIPLREKGSMPSLAQTNHILFFGEEHTVNPFKTFKPEENDHFVSASFSNNYPQDSLIVLGSNKGNISLYNNPDEKKYLHLKKGFPVKILKFSDDDSLIIGVCGNELILISKNFEDFHFQTARGPIKALSILDDRDSFITLCDESVSVWSFVSKRMPKDKIPDMLEVVIDTATLRQQFCCAFLNNGVLYVLTTDHKINVYDTVEPQRLKSITTFDNEVNDYVTSVDMHISDNSFDVLFLFKYKNNILKFYTQKTLMYSRPRRNPIFDCYWTETQPRIANITVNNTVEISNNFNILNDLDNLLHVVTAICFSTSGDSIAYGTDNGHVVDYKIKTNQKNCILKLPSAILHLKYFNKGEILVASGKHGDLMVRFVSKDRVIKLWYLNDESMTVLKGSKYYNVPHTVQMCTMSKDSTFLALTMSNMFEVFLLDIKNEALNLVDFGGAQLEYELHSCCFSHDNKYLAFGSVDGPIIGMNKVVYVS